MPQAKSSSFETLSLSIILVILLTLGIIYLTTGSDLLRPQQVPSPQPTLVPINTAGWQTFNDTYLKVSVKHPPKWKFSRGSGNISSCLTNPGQNEEVDGIDDTSVCFFSQNFNSSQDVKKQIQSLLKNKFGDQLARQITEKQTINKYSAWYTQFDLEQDRQLNQNIWVFLEDKKTTDRYFVVSTASNIYTQVISNSQRKMFNLLLETFHINQ